MLPSPVRFRCVTRCLLHGLVVLLAVGGLTFASSTESSAQQCPAGQVLSDNGVTCEIDPSQNTQCPAGQELDALGLNCVEIEVEESPCPEGQQLNSTGLRCVAIAATGPCPSGQQLDQAGIRCVPKPPASSGPAGACDRGYSLGPDGRTCVADPPKCRSGEVLGDNGTCVKSFQCPAGQILASNLLSCSSRCPAGELVSVDGKRCLAPGSKCPDGSPRPVSGSCLVVETIEGADGTPEVIVRCAAADSFCQAQVKRCAEERAGGGSGDADCEDPRASCDDDDNACQVANDRIVTCATRGDAGDAGDDGEPIRIGGRNDPCDDLCPPLHRLDPSGDCVEFLDPIHPCVSFGKVPRGVTTNRQLDNYSYLAGTGQCVTKAEFLRRLGNFEAAAGAEADALVLLRETTSSYLSAEEQLADLENRLAAARQQVRDFTDAAAEADLERGRNLKALYETRKLLVRESRVLRADVLDVFVTGGKDALVQSAILHATNVTEIGVAQAYGRSLLDDQIDNIDQITALEAKTEALASAIDASIAQLELSLQGAVDASSGLEQLVAEAEELRKQQLLRRDEEALLVAAIRKDKAVYAEQLGIFEQASREIADIIAESEFLVGEFEDCGQEGETVFANPVVPAEITSGFGPRLHPILGYVRNHNGVDMSAASGDPIFATAPGIVTIASSFGGFGNTVVIAHGGNLLTLYAHMSAIGVSVGDEVECGDILGLIGSTGLSTGPHLHFEVWVDGRTAVDPFPYLTQVKSIEDEN